VAIAGGYLFMRSFSFGGGVQSHGVLVLTVYAKRAKQGDRHAIRMLRRWINIKIKLRKIIDILDYDVFLFSNVGRDSESPGTIGYMLKHTYQYCSINNIDMREIFRTLKNGNTETLFERLTKEGSRSIPIPVRMNNTGAPGTRSCTVDFKIKVIGKWLKSNGASKKNKCVTGLGISIDEFQRMRTNSENDFQILHYPLIELRLSRSDCIRIINDAGLPTPPKSSCWFCPFHRPKVWQEMKDQDPALFDKAVELEALINNRRLILERAPVWLSSALKPLDQAFQGNQDMMDLDDNCESGYCHT
jgi:hypothetical protein